MAVALCILTDLSQERQDLQETMHCINFAVCWYCRSAWPDDFPGLWNWYRSGHLFYLSLSSSNAWHCWQLSLRCQLSCLFAKLSKKDSIKTLKKKVKIKNIFLLKPVIFLNFFLVLFQVLLGISFFKIHSGLLSWEILNSSSLLSTDCIPINRGSRRARFVLKW